MNRTPGKKPEPAHAARHQLTPLAARTAGSTRAQDLDRVRTGRPPATPDRYQIPGIPGTRATT